MNQELIEKVAADLEASRDAAEKALPTIALGLVPNIKGGQEG